jgi:hypothetical protein
MSKGRGEGVGWMRKVFRVQRSKNPRGAKILGFHTCDDKSKCIYLVIFQFLRCQATGKIKVFGSQIMEEQVASLLQK